MFFILSTYPKALEAAYRFLSDHKTWVARDSMMEISRLPGAAASPGVLTSPTAAAARVSSASTTAPDVVGNFMFNTRGNWRSSFHSFISAELKAPRRARNVGGT